MGAASAKVERNRAAFRSRGAAGAATVTAHLYFAIHTG